MTTSSTSWIYLAGPLFTQAEIGFNQRLADRLDDGLFGLPAATGVFWHHRSLNCLKFVFGVWMEPVWCW